MIINKTTKCWRDRTGFKHNWLDNDWIYADTNSDLGRKIIAHAPYIDLIIENGVLIDVEITEKPFDPAEFKLKQAAKISDSKLKLAEWLEGHPMQFSDGEFYSVTAEKQTLLNSNLTSYERADSAGLAYPLKWNSTGAECKEWTYEALVGLSLAIAAYVAPKVALQQAFEIEINGCKSFEQLDGVVIDYGG